MAWLLLVLAGMGEVIGVAGISRLNRSRDPLSFVLLIGGFVLSLTFLSIAMQSISMGTAYAVWTGMGTVGSTLVGMFLYGESKDARRLLFIAMVLSAAVGLKLIA
ncbi:multidrug efflux SMR transporter [Paenibacillus sp. alder61]|uniref:Multidrug efflux SMR transporter n=1 Tax=Paenibacillus faecis TaxID=862114 RepID=A0A5D0CW64_9BACL|nr:MULTISPECIES: multidrug efflux SMR transporter [Paenibacillus]MCA1296320.1 multidrug efflux SMR transporter [Paenibacillus sp. alder61]TYA14152.1 multidrug efflux SMR transporter [Paenibacillus faecis]